MRSSSSQSKATFWRAGGKARKSRYIRSTRNILTFGFEMKIFLAFFSMKS